MPDDIDDDFADVPGTWTDDQTLGTGTQPPRPQEPTAANEALEVFRKKLLDLTGRNRLISFPHNAKSKKIVRIVNEVGTIVLKKLISGEELLLAPIPAPNLEPEDEKSPKFRDELQRMRINNTEYLQKLSALELNSSEAQQDRLEGWLRDETRIRLGLPPIMRITRLSVEERAKELAINLDFDLPTGHATSQEHHLDNELQTPYFPDNLNRRLELIYKQARLNESETGISSLHLAFGFLEWKEAPQAEGNIFSPLILLPVELIRKLDRNQYSFYLKVADTDVVTNFSLQQRLLKDFDLVLPSIESIETSEAYLQEISILIEKHSHWYIRRFLTLGFFPFSKMAMFQDLDASGWDDVQNPTSLLNVICSGQEIPQSTVPFECDVEALKPNSVLCGLVKDADSSQIDALNRALSGSNLVIEGPPGTGKSQTITNLIANALAQGKRVLFVAEKNAALNVVKSRLDEVGLGPLCLELHSNKAQKIKVLESLKRSLELSHTNVSEGQLKDTHALLTSIKQNISTYVLFLNTPLPTLEKTPFDLMWVIENTRTSHPDLYANFLDVELPNVTDLTPSKLSEALYQLGIVEEATKRAEYHEGPIYSHPWFPFLNSNMRETDIADTAQIFEKLKVIAIEIFNCSKKNWNEQLASSLTITNISALIKLAQNIQSVERIHPFFFKNDPNKEMVFHTQTLLNDIDQFLSLRTHLLKFLDEEALNTSSLSEWERLLTEIGTVSKNLLFADLERLGLSISHQRDQLKTSYETLNVMLEAAKMAITPTNQCLSILKSLLPHLKLLQKKFPFWNTVLLSEDSSLLVEQCQTEQRRIKEMELELSSALVLNHDLDADTLWNVGATIKSAGIFSIFSSAYRNAVRMSKGLLKENKKLSKSQIGNLLQTYSQYLKLRKEFLTSSKAKRIAHKMFAGLETDFASISEVVSAVSEIRLRGNQEPFFDRAISAWLPIFDSQDLSRLIMTIDANESADLAAALQKTNCRTYQQALQHLEKRCENLLAIHNRGRLLGLKPTTDLREMQSILRDLESYRALNTRINENRILTDVPKPINLKDERELLAQSISYLGLVAAIEPWHGSEAFLFAPDSIEALKLLLNTPDIDKLQGDFFSNVEKLQRINGNNNSSLLLECAVSNVPRIADAVLFSRTQAEAVRQVVLAEKAITEPIASDLLSAYRNLKEDFVLLSESLDYCLAKTIMRITFEANPHFAKYSGTELDKLRERFCETDKRLMELTRQRILALALAKRFLPEGSTGRRKSEFTELSLIRQEIGKKMRHIPLRSLFARAQSAILGLKPCIMMSPLSAAQFLKKGEKLFDLVVIDEASQMRPEDAIGSILRGKQAVVVGDSKQLPPTSFGIFNSNDDEYESENDQPDVSYESILDLFSKGSRNPAQLKWHYRSRHESLIAFSNHAFYEGDLVVFPAPNNPDTDLGLTLSRVVDGSYENSLNHREAQQIVSTLLEQIVKHPDRSIGIVAVNHQQAELISHLIDELARVEPQIEAYRAKWEHLLEPLIIKNLENMQGDERDTILISLVYGPDKTGKVYQRFGPINGSTGHRRLNVLFSRARKKMILVTSLTSEHIIETATSSRGLRALKGFLKYAETGILPSITPGQSMGGTDNPFEASVKRAIESAGYEVRTQIGVSGFRIDLAVVDPNNSGSYLIGIECDGATYHSSRSARDRDRLRQEILEGLGWTLARIWSTDWYRQPRKELDRLLKSIEIAQRARQTPASQLRSTAG